MLRFISDPGHGWLEVPMSIVESLHIKDEISKYSYLYKGMAYLEEDCDAGKFMKAFEKLFGVEPKIHEVHQERSPIRSYPRFRA